MFTIVPANLNLAEHATALVSLLDHYARDPMGGATPLKSTTRENLVAELLKRPTAHIVLAFDGATPAGMIISFEGFSTFACQPLLNIHDVIVHSNYRGQRLFNQMLAQLETTAVKLGCCKLTMEVLEGNHAALSAYKASGFAGYELDPEMGKAIFWQKKL